MFGVFDGQAFRCGLYCAFGCAIPDDIWPWTRGGGATQIDEAASLLGDEVWHYHFAAVEERFDIDADEAVELGFVDFVARGRFLHHAGVVHHDVEFAETVQSGFERGLPRRELGDVSCYCDNVSGWVGGCDVGRELGVDVHYDDFGAFGCVFLCDCWMVSR